MQREYVVYSILYIAIVYTIPRVSFSPESGGRVKPRRAMEEMSTEGTMRLKK
jgi:hypothetical protein